MGVQPTRLHLHNCKSCYHTSLVYDPSECCPRDTPCSTSAVRTPSFPTCALCPLHRYVDRVASCLLFACSVGWVVAACSPSCRYQLLRALIGAAWELCACHSSFSTAHFRVRQCVLRWACVVHPLRPAKQTIAIATQGGTVLFCARRLTRGFLVHRVCCCLVSTRGLRTGVVGPGYMVEWSAWPPHAAMPGTGSRHAGTCSPFYFSLFSFPWDVSSASHQRLCTTQPLMWQ